MSKNVIPPLGHRYMVDEKKFVTAFVVYGMTTPTIVREMNTCGEYKTKMIKSRTYTLVFDQAEAQRMGKYRLATGDDLNDWVAVSRDIPRDRVVVCEDGLYFFLETFTYERDLGICNFTSSFVKIDR